MFLQSCCCRKVQWSMGTCGCYIGNRRGRGRGFKFHLGVERLKGRLGKYRWLGSDLSNLSGVSRSELLIWENVIYTMVFELVSECMPDEVLS